MLSTVKLEAQGQQATRQSPVRSEWKLIPFVRKAGGGGWKARCACERTRAFSLFRESGLLLCIRQPLTVISRGVAEGRVRY